MYIQLVNYWDKFAFRISVKWGMCVYLWVVILGPEDDDTSDILAEESDDETFCHIDKCEVMEDCLYLFARTDREKEDW